MRLGFIGTGALTAAIVAGLKSLADDHVSILLSPRNEQIAADLAARYAGVRVAADNQAVLDGSDTVMLAVRPQVAPEVLPQLRFRKDHHVVSLIATISLEKAAAFVAPAQRTTKALPMPMVAHRQGATIIYPPDARISALFRALGKTIEVKDAAAFDALSVVTATFAAYFKYLDTIHRWLGERGVGDPTARDYVASLYKALAHAPDAAPAEGFLDLSAEYATRGGINEQVLNELSEQGVFEAFAESLDRVHRRIGGREGPSNTVTSFLFPAGRGWPSEEEAG